MTVHLVRPGELGPAEIATWHSMQDATLSLADPFLSPEFARAVGRVQPDTRVAVLAGRETTTGFFPFERRRFGVGVPVGGWLSLSQGRRFAPISNGIGQPAEMRSGKSIVVLVNCL